MKHSILLSLTSFSLFFSNLYAEEKQPTSKETPSPVVEQIARGDAFLRSLPIISNKTDVLFVADHTTLKKTTTMASLLKNRKEAAATFMLNKISQYFAVADKDIKRIAISANLTSYNPDSIHTVDYIIMIDLSRSYSAEDYFAIAAKLGNRDGEFKGTQPESKKWGKTYGLALEGETKPLYITLLNAGETLIFSNNESLLKKTISQNREGELKELPSEHLKQFSILLNSEIPYGLVMNFSPELRKKFVTQNIKKHGLDTHSTDTALTYSIWEELSEVQTILAIGEFPKGKFSAEAMIVYTDEKGPVQTAKRISRLTKFFAEDKTLPVAEKNFIMSLKRISFSRLKEQPEVLRTVFTGDYRHLNALYGSVEKIPELQAKVDIGKAQNRFKEEDYIIPAADAQAQGRNPFKGSKAGSASMGFGKAAKK